MHPPVQQRQYTTPGAKDALGFLFMDYKTSTPTTNYVPAEPVAPSQFWLSSLRTKILTDISVSIGATLLTAVLLGATGRAWSVVVYGSGIVGIIVLGVRLTGLLGASRMAGVIAWQQVKLAEVIDHNRLLVAEIDDMEASLVAFRLNLVAVQAELDAIKSRGTGYRSAEQLERSVRMDALALIELASNRGGWVARDAALSALGWERQRWESADALLLRAGVIARNHRTTTILATGAEALTLLDKAVQ